MVETRVIDAALWRSLWQFGGGGAALVICALFSRSVLCPCIAQPLVALSGMAAALGRGEHIPARHLNLREAQATADQMRGAGAALEQRAHEVDQLYATLNEHARALEVVNKELELFAYSVSHDLRTPLRAIDGFSRILVRIMGRDGQRGQASVAGRAGGATRMGHLIDDILSFSRLGRRQLPQRKPIWDRWSRPPCSSLPPPW